MTTCPLPVDWLDLLEGRPSVADRAHLGDCPSCRAVVAALSTSGSVGAEPVATKTWTVAADTPVARLPKPPVFEHADVGQLWWTIEVPKASSRLAVLVISVEEQAGSTSWLDVVPLWLDDAAATSGDLLLAPTDTSTDVWWRALFRHQLVLSQAQLDAPIGMLTDSGAALLEQAVSGQLPLARTGSLIEGEYDRRLAVDAWIADASRLLAAEYAVWSELPDEEAQRGSNVRYVGAARHAVTGVLLVLNVSREPAPKEMALYELAAASEPSVRQWVRASGHDDRTGAHVDGWLRLSEHEQLVFEVKEVRGVPARVRISVYTRPLPTAISAEAELRAGTDVLLGGADLGISEFDVERLELVPA
jgi:hypothetical protein